jgi:leucyl-tRNA synthetase
VQVSGKVRARLEVAATSSDDELTALALADPNVQKAMAGKEPRRIIVRAPKLVNVVV